MIFSPTLSLLLLAGITLIPEPGMGTELTAAAGESRYESFGIIPEGAFVIEGQVDPSIEPGGHLQAVATVMLGWSSEEPPVMRNQEMPAIGFEIREGSGLGMWEVWIDGINETTRQPDPKPAGWAWDGKNQQPHHFLQRDIAYPIRIVGQPDDDGTKLEIYFEHFDRPAATHRVARDLSGLPVHLLSNFGGNERATNTSRFEIEVRAIALNEANRVPSPREVVLRALDFSRPELKAVAGATRKGNEELAGQLLLRHLRLRTKPQGPTWEEVAEVVLHPDYRTIAAENVAGRYGNLAWYAQFDSKWTDASGETHARVLPGGSINWARENGHLNRHFHWVALAKTWEETRDSKYAKHFSHEVHDWVTREPFFWDQCPQVGGVSLMDGTVFRKGYMNTSNIGRRCELTWWPTYEVFRKSSDFTDEAHFAMLLGFLRQSRLLMNPTSFAAHDDGGAHGSMALLQNALMLPEFRESMAWKAEALRRWDEVLKVQFYPDGSHVSGSTGYNWASIHAIENFIRLMRRSGAEVPARFTETLERALHHPIGLSRPDQGQIDMNDGGWGMVEDHFSIAVEKFFPGHPTFTWMATKGKQGTPPEFTSIAYSHAGHLVQRTGWGGHHKFLFLDAGPLGASHGKNDKLNLYLAIGPHQLISSGGRGSYDANPFSGYAGSTFGYNTILVDDLPQQRIHLKHTHTGHVAEKRRWASTEHFDFMEGFYRSGWYGSEKSVQGVHTRQIVFLKGEKPPETGYWVVVDQVESDDDQEHEFKALFHSRRDEAEIDSETRSFTGVDRGAGFRILPGDPKGLSVRNARGQMEPYIQGWHVVGTNKAPMHTAEYAWRAAGATRRIWILEATNLPVKWQVESWSESEELFEIARKDGGIDRIHFFPENRGTVSKVESVAGDRRVSELKLPSSP